MKIEAYSPTIRRKEMDAVLTTMVGEKIGPGEQAQRLANCAKEFLQFDYSVSLRSPAIALYHALKLLDIPAGSGIVLSALSPRYYVYVIKELNLVPVYCDVDETTVSMTQDTVQSSIKRFSEQSENQLRCILVHHSLGFVPDTASIAELGIPIIEDCSRSYGTNIGEKKAGSFGVMTLLGMEERDILTAGGGALLYATERRNASALRTLNALPDEYKLTDMNAAMAIVQFKESERNYQRRKEIAQIYLQSALRTRHGRFVQNGEAEYNNYSFPLVLQTGLKDVQSYASKKDIILENAFSDTVIGDESFVPDNCPVAYSLSLRTVLFPLYPRLSSSKVNKVAKVIATLP